MTSEISRSGRHSSDYGSAPTAELRTRKNLLKISEKSHLSQNPDTEMDVLEGLNQVPKRENMTTEMTITVLE